jgi:DNA topoisomerase-2
MPSDDLGCLTYRDDDGLPVEPEWYAPIIPMLLVNGARGIGTGYSTYIPPCDPNTLVAGLKHWLKGGSIADINLVPSFKGFNGSIEKNESDYTVKGVWTVNKDILTITELPIETWTSDYKEYLSKLETEGTIKEFQDTSTDTIVNIRIKFATPEQLAIIEKSLTSKIKLTNMHAFDSFGVIHKYDSLHAILEEFAGVRMSLYDKRRNHLLEDMKNKLPYHENVVRFIEMQCEKTPVPDLRRKTTEECNALLEEQKFAKIPSYDYLLDLPIKSITKTVADKHRSELEKLRESIRSLEGMTAKDLWLSDLEAFSKIYSKSK